MISFGTPYREEAPLTRYRAYNLMVVDEVGVLILTTIDGIVIDTAPNVEEAKRIIDSWLNAR